MSQEPKNNRSNSIETKEKISSWDNVRLMGMILVIYIMLLSAIGYVAFWEQDFNKAENIIGSYLEELKKIDEYKNLYQDDVYDQQLVESVNIIMKEHSDSAGDLQELASQSFNIVLGALLAFLASLSTMIFQSMQNSSFIKKNSFSKNSSKN